MLEAIQSQDLRSLIFPVEDLSVALFFFLQFDIIILVFSSLTLVQTLVSGKDL